MRFKSAIWTIVISFAAFLPGCGSGGGITPPSTTNTSTTTTPPVIVLDNSATIADDIKMGVSTTIPLGLLVIPDQTEAKEISTLAKQVIDTNILPILNGDDAGIIAALPEILSLKAFDNPKLAKVELILELAKPYLVKYLPADLVSGQTTKISPQVKLYLISFFQGADNGLGEYLGGKTLNKALESWANVREKSMAKPQ